MLEADHGEGGGGGCSHEGDRRDDTLKWGDTVRGAVGNVFMRTSLFLLLVNQLRESSLHLLH